LKKLEIETNKEEDQRNVGTAVAYGQTVQLYHLPSATYLCCVKTNTGTAISFAKEASSACFFKFMPSFKVRLEGHSVKTGDQVVLVHVKSNFTLTIANGELNMMFAAEAGFAIDRYSPVSTQEKFVETGASVRLFHREKSIRIVIVFFFFL
jgi:hypothetical protein